MSDPGEARSVIDRVIDEELDEDAVRALIREIKASAKPKKVWVTIDCKHCSRAGNYQVEVPVTDPLKKAQALDKWLSQGKGTPKQTHRVEMNMKVAAVRSTADLDAMSNAQLDEYIAAAALAAGAQAALPRGSE